MELIASLREVAHSYREWIRAVAIICDITISDGRDAVRVDLEHRDGVTLEILVPFERRRIRRSKMRFDYMTVSYAPPWVWGA